MNPQASTLPSTLDKRYTLSSLSHCIFVPPFCFQGGISGGSRGGARGDPAPPPYFSTKMRPGGRKNFFGRPPPPPYLKVWISHWVCRDFFEITFTPYKHFGIKENPEIYNGPVLFKTILILYLIKLQVCLWLSMARMEKPSNLRTLSSCDVKK